MAAVVGEAKEVERPRTLPFAESFHITFRKATES